jgi:steroid delta-isomerase-like uncharacterized protein
MSENVARLVTDLLNTWNAHDLERLATFYAPEYEGIDVAYAVPRRGPKEVCQTMALYLQAFPDLNFTLEELLVQDNHAAMAFTVRGTHQGKLMNIPPTGRAVTVRGSTFFTVNDCQITHGLHIWDMAGVLRGLGLLPEL